MRAIQADSGAKVFWQKVFRTTLVRLIPFNRAILVTMPSVRERVWPIEQVLELESKVSSKGAGIKGGENYPIILLRCDGIKNLLGLARGSRLSTESDH